MEEFFPFYLTLNLSNGKKQRKSFLLTKLSIKILYICKQDNKDLPYPKSIIIKGMLYGRATLWRNITMKRKPKMHNEQEFNLDNVYQEDERQLDNLDDSSFDLRYK